FPLSLHDALPIFRALIGVAPTDASCDVEDGCDTASHERLSTDPVQVDMVDDRHVTGTQAWGQVLGTSIRPDGSDQPGGGFHPSAAKPCDCGAERIRYLHRWHTVRTRLP